VPVKSQIAKWAKNWMLASAVSIGILGCHQSSPWNGNWKLIPSNSSVPGPSFTITLTPAGEYQTDNGTYSYRYRCDGKEYPMAPGYTTSCKRTGAFVIDSTTKKNGAVVTTAHWELSADEASLRIKLIAGQSQRPLKTKEVVYERVSGSAGFIGGWRELNRLQTQPQLLALMLHGRDLHYAFPKEGQYVDLTLDGPDGAWQGPSVPPGITVAIKTLDHDELLVLRKLNGQVVNQGSMRISPDGHTLVEEFWSPDRPNLKTILVYEKQ
jgi:hypothetical protein